MALISCPECGRMVSDKALSCPNCGTPINMRLNIPVAFVRERAMYGALLKLRVEVDSQFQGVLSNGDIFETELLTGRHIVALHIGNLHVMNEVIIPDYANEAVIKVTPHAKVASVQVK